MSEATWKTCKTHGPGQPDTWGCPECVRELREENNNLRSTVDILLEIAEQIVDTRRCSVGILSAMNSARKILADQTVEHLKRMLGAAEEER